MDRQLVLLNNPSQMINKETINKLIVEINKLNINKTMKDGHYHNYYEIYYLVSGKCDYCIDNVIYSLESNGLIFIPNNVIHKTVYKVDDYERIVLNFTGDYIDPLLVNNLTDVFVCNLKNPVDIDYIAHIFRNINTNVYNKVHLEKQVHYILA